MSLRNLGADIVPDGVNFTAWAPERKAMTVTVTSPTASSPRVLTLDKREDGYFTAVDSLGRAGDRYTFKVDGGADLPDLASRFQPDGLMGPSEVIDPLAYRWKTVSWKRPEWQGHVIYELHVGTFTKEGTFQAARRHLDHLVELGVTAVEIMPVAQCTGGRNWGYDGVLLFAPYHPYGRPDEMRAFIDDCHGRGLAVILDAVYNHIGAIGDFTDDYSRFLSHADHIGAWGKSFNLDGKHSPPVRHFLLQNIEYWLKEFRIDGYRLDAAHAIHDRSEKHLLMEASKILRAYGAYMIAEDERRSADILKPVSQGGWGVDAVWADDFHHATRKTHTKETHGPLGRYLGSLHEVADILQHGWHYRGDARARKIKPQSTVCDHLPPERFIDYISNHDQVGNLPYGDRLHKIISPEAYRALSLFFCFIPYTPLLFMGQEWAATSPFLYFTDHPAESGKLVSAGREREFNLDAQASTRPIPDCQAESTFENSKLEWGELNEVPHRHVLDLYREGLKLRRQIFAGKNPTRDSWKISADDGRLTMTYEWPNHRLEVSLETAHFPNAKPSSLPLLLRSNESRFGGVTSEEIPEAFVRFT